MPPPCPLVASSGLYRIYVVHPAKILYRAIKLGETDKDVLKATDENIQLFNGRIQEEYRRIHGAFGGTYRPKTYRQYINDIRRSIILTFINKDYADEYDKLYSIVDYYGRNNKPIPPEVYARLNKLADNIKRDITEYYRSLPPDAQRIVNKYLSISKREILNYIIGQIKQKYHRKLRGEYIPYDKHFDDELFRY